MSKHVMVFGSGNADAPTRMRALEDGVSTTLVCRASHLPRLVDPEGHARLLVLRDETSIEECTALARAVHAVHPVTHIATLGEHDQDRAAAVGAALGVRTHAVRTVELAHRKDAMRARLAEAGIDDTRAELVPDVAALRAFATRHGYPLVVKPVAGLASLGVSVVREPDELEAAFAAADGTGDGWHRRVGVLAEEYLAGPEYSVEALSEDGEHVVVAVTEKHTDAATRVELGHVVPAPLAEGTRAQIARLVLGVLDALCVEFGATHTEVVLTAAGPRVVETHVRMGGDEIGELVHGATGVDLVACQLRQSLGQRVLPEVRATLAAPRAHCAHAIWFAVPPASGELLEVLGVPDDDHNGTTDTHDDDHVVVTVAAKPGTVFAGLKSSYSRPASARCGGASAAEALGRARAAVAGVSFLTKVPALNPTSSPL